MKDIKRLNRWHTKQRERIDKKYDKIRNKYKKIVIAKCPLRVGQVLVIPSGWVGGNGKRTMKVDRIESIIDKDKILWTAVCIIRVPDSEEKDYLEISVRENMYSFIKEVNSDCL